MALSLYENILGISVKQTVHQKGFEHVSALSAVWPERERSPYSTQHTCGEILICTVHECDFRWIRIYSLDKKFDQIVVSMQDEISGRSR